MPLNINRRIEYHRVYQDTAYLAMLQEILKSGFRSMDRTGTGTISINGYQTIYDMSRHSYYTESKNLVVDNFPLFTTKFVPMRILTEELLWFLRGETNIKNLVDANVNIWNAWPLKAYNNLFAVLRTIPPIAKSGQQATEEEFIEAIKTDPEFAATYGELGPVYGKQWRRWATYNERSEEYGTASDAIDQLANMINLLKVDPESRRNIVTAWNPADIEEMTKAGLPPCHMEFQVFTRPNPENTSLPYLDMQLYQRSLDSFLGAPFNVASYALLMCMLAAEVGMLPGRFIHQIGSAHIYLNHIDQIKEQLSREPYRSPKLLLMAKGKNILATSKDDKQSYSVEDIVISDYNKHGRLFGDVAV